VRGRPYRGSSEILQQDQKDGFPTVYTQPDGLDLSGVEIAATAFANILENRPFDRRASAPMSRPSSLGMVIGALCRMLNPAIATAATAGLCLLYLLAAHHRFELRALVPRSSSPVSPGAFALMAA